MRRTASEIIRSLEIRVAKLESDSWLKLDFKTKPKDIKLSSKPEGVLEDLIGDLNKEIGDPKLVDRVQKALFAPIRIIVKIRDSYQMESSFYSLSIEKKEGSSKVTLNFRVGSKTYLSTGAGLPLEAEEERGFKLDWNRPEEAPISKLLDETSVVSYDPIKRQITSKPPVLISRSFPTSFSKEVENYARSREAKETMLRNEIRDWADNHLQEANKMIVDNDFDVPYEDGFKSLSDAIDTAIEDYVDGKMTMGDDDYWYGSGSDKGTRDYKIEDLREEESVLVDSKVVGLGDDPERPLFVFLIDFEGYDDEDVGEHDATLVVWDFARGEYDIKYGSLTKMKGLYKSM